MRLAFVGVVALGCLVGCGGSDGGGGTGGDGGSGSGGSGGAGGSGGSASQQPVSLAAGAQHVCALFDDGGVRCWGNNSDGQLGIGSTESIGDDEQVSEGQPVPLEEPAIALDAGRAHTCVLLESHRIQCWGNNTVGQLGIGSKETIGDDEPVSDGGFAQVGGEVAQMSAGASHVCALLTNGSLRCWGLSMAGELGYGNLDTIGDDEAPSMAGDVPVGFNPQHIWAGFFRTCAWDAQQVACWGINNVGQLGRGNTDNVGDDEPASAGSVSPGFGLEAVGGGIAHTCFVGTGGELKCVGAGMDGQLGSGGTDDLGDDEPLSSVSALMVGEVIKVTGGQRHTCALKADGTIRCWGAGDAGQLGKGDTLSVDAADATSDLDLPKATDLACTMMSCCALTVDGVRCWGSGDNGVLGTGSTDAIGDDEPARSGQAVRFAP
ncbi:MAG: hypothetical protein KC766_23060 [Myxococcales bacterium]|nr:hypothetical protein [Myxococcales bacterium]